MIILADRDFKVVKKCQTDEEFCSYICSLKNQENQKTLLDPESPVMKWEFMRCHHRFLKIFFETIDQNRFREMAEQAYAHHQNLLIIYKGVQESPFFASVSSDFQFEQLKTDWAKSYAKGHGFHVITE
jgi:hypothetical protein